MEKCFLKTCRILYGIVMGSILCLLLICGHINYFLQHNPPPANYYIFVAWAAVIIIGITVYFAYTHKKSHPHRIHFFSPTRNLIIIASFLLLIGQLYVCYNCFFTTGWDVFYVQTAATEWAAGRYELDDSFLAYYSSYPNNLLLTFITTIILKLNAVIGVFQEPYAMMSTVVISCMINTGTCILVYKTALLFTKPCFAAIGYLAAVLTIGVSPWSIIFYSDAAALGIPLLVIYLFLRPTVNRISHLVCRCLAAAVAMIGYFIKPQCIFPLLGAAILYAVRFRRPFSLKYFRQPVAVLLTCAVTMIGVQTLIDIGCKKVDFHPDPEKALGAAHFFMMSHNSEYNGAYVLDDVLFSQSIPTSSERTRQNLLIAFQRIQEMGFIGNLQHLKYRMLGAFNDGTFAFGREGMFYRYISPPPNTRVAPVLRSLYFPSGQAHQLYFYFAQTMWIGVLLLSTISCLTKKNNPCNRFLPIFWITILGLVAYEMLFEVRARYVYIFVPLFCVLAAVGMETLCSFIQRRCYSFQKRKV